MGGTLNGTLQKKREENKSLNESRQIVVTTADLKKLETWGVPQDQLLRTRETYRQRIIPFQREMDRRANEILRKQYSETNVERAVLVNTPPVQQVPVTQESSKARRKRMQKEAEVEHLCPRSLNKEETYDLSHTVKENLQGCRNACKDNHVAERCEDEADYNTILAFCQGYRTNMLGLAANREESQKKQADRNFINAYFNHDEPQEVYPYLDAIVEDLLQTEISKDMFSEEDFRRRGPELKKLRDKMIGLERLKEKYPGYFVDHLPKFKRYTLDAMGWFVPAFDKMMEVNMKKRGVNLSDGEYDSDQVTEEELNGEMLEATYRFNDALKQYEINKEQINLEEVDRRLPELEALQRGDFEQIKRTFEENSGPGQEFEKYEGLRFTNYGYLYQYNDMVDRREMLIKNPQKYAENKELVDRIYNEIYRAMDIGADYYFKSKALSIGMDDMSAYSRGQMDRDLRGVFAKRQEETMDDLEEINHRILGLTDVLQYVLKGKPLTNLGGLTLEQLRNSADYDAGNENEEGGNQ